MQEPNWKTRATSAVWTFFTVAAIILFYYLLGYIAEIFSFFSEVLSTISPVVIGLIIAYLLDPIACFFEKRVQAIFVRRKKPLKNQKAPRVIGSVLAVILGLLFVFFIGMLVVPELYNSMYGIVSALPSQMEGLMAQLQDKSLFDNATTMGAYMNEGILSALQSLEDWLKSELPSRVNVLWNYLYSSVMIAFTTIFHAVVGVVLSIYALIDKEKMLGQCKKLCFALLPIDTAKRASRVFKRCNKKFSGAIRGKLLDSFLIGFFCFVLMTLLGLLPMFDWPYPVLLAVIVGVTNVVPFFGPFVGAFITGVLVLFNDPSMVIPHLLMILVLQQYDCNYQDPHIVGSSVGLRPFYSIFACLLGSALFGVPGYVIGAPLFGLVYELLNEWSADKLRQKNLGDTFDLSHEEEENTAEAPQEETHPPIEE